MVLVHHIPMCQRSLDRFEVFKLFVQMLAGLLLMFQLRRILFELADVGTKIFSQRFEFRDQVFSSSIYFFHYRAGQLELLVLETFTAGFYH